MNGFCLKKRLLLVMLLVAALFAMACDEGEKPHDGPHHHNNEGNHENNNNNGGNNNSGTANPNYKPNPDKAELKIVANPGGPHSSFKRFTKYVNVFGAGIFATAGTADAKVLHAANVLAQYIDNDADGKPDNTTVHNALVKHKAALVMFPKEGTSEESSFPGPSLGKEITMSQNLYGFETRPGGAAKGEFDASLEEVLHLYTHAGYSVAYPEIFGEKKGTKIAALMAAALKKKTYNPFANEPDMDYPSQVTEYIYWGLTSILGGQDFSGRYDNIKSEWTLNTTEKVKNQDPELYKLLTDPTYKFPTKLPDGAYKGNK